MAGKNQHKPQCKLHGLLMHFYSHAFHIAPDEDIQEHLRHYYELGLMDVKVTEALKQHYDTDTYGMRYVSYVFHLWVFLSLPPSVFLLFENCGSSGISYQPINKSIHKNPFITKSTKFRSAFQCVGQRVSRKPFEWIVAFVSLGKQQLHNYYNQVELTFSFRPVITGLLKSVEDDEVIHHL